MNIPTISERAARILLTSLGVLVIFGGAWMYHAHIADASVTYQFRTDITFWDGFDCYPSGSVSGVPFGSCDAAHVGQGWSTIQCLNHFECDAEGSCGNIQYTTISCEAVVSACTPDSSCAASTYQGSTCTDSCGNVYAGTIPIPADSPAGCGAELPTGINCIAGEPTFTQCSASQMGYTNAVATTKSCRGNGYSATNNWGYCVASAACNACVPSAACAASTPVGSTCSDSCGNVYAGTQSGYTQGYYQSSYYAEGSYAPGVCTLPGSTNVGSNQTGVNKWFTGGTAAGTYNVVDSSCLATCYAAGNVYCNQVAVYHYGAEPYTDYRCTGITNPTSVQSQPVQDAYPLTSRTYSANSSTCSIPGVSGSCSLPSVTITATPSRVKTGQTTTLRVAGTGISTSCIVSGPGISQTLNASSCGVSQNITTPAITANSVYTVTCDSGAATGKVIVNIPFGVIEF